MRFPVVIHKDPGSDYGVSVPDLPGCFSAGETIDEALTAAVEAIELHLEGILLDGEPIPSPQPIEHHQSNPDFSDAIWALATIDMTRIAGKSKRVNVTIPERVLYLIDKHAAKIDESRSGFLTQAAMAYIADQAQNSED